MDYLLLALFGFVGLFARVACNSLFQNVFHQHSYISTAVINILGSFVMGAIYGATSQRALLTDEVRTAIMVGFLGSFTTFSAFSLDTLKLFESGNYWIALTYSAGSAVGSITACYLGVLIARRFV